MAKLTKNTLVTLVELVDITGRTKQNVNKIAADGKISRHARGVYKIGEVLRAMLTRRETVLPTQERYWRAKAELMEHQTALAKRKVITIEEHRAVCQIMEAQRMWQWQTVPTLLFRSWDDRDKRRALEAQMTELWLQANKRIERELKLLYDEREPDEINGDGDDDNEEETSETETQREGDGDNE
jgi:hypothetical protein